AGCHAYYPEDVAGVVLVDASHEDVDVVIPRGRALLHLPRPFRQMVVGAIAVSQAVGLLRLLNGKPQSDRAAAGFSQTEWATLRRLEAMPKLVAASASEDFEESAAQARAARNLGDRPVVVLTAGRPTLVRGETAADAAYDQRKWIELQTE